MEISTTFGERRLIPRGICWLGILGGEDAESIFRHKLSACAFPSNRALCSQTSVDIGLDWQTILSLACSPSHQLYVNRYLYAGVFPSETEFYLSLHF